MDTGPEEIHGFSDVITSFYKTGELPADAEACLDQGIPVEFVVDITDNKGIVLLGSKIFKGDENEVYIPLGISLLLVLIGFLGLPIFALIRFLKKRKNKELTGETFYVDTLDHDVFHTLFCRLVCNRA